MENLNEINVPKPGSFDTTVLVKNSESEWVIDEEVKNDTQLIDLYSQICSLDIKKYISKKIKHLGLITNLD